jgi:hypothetical protein
MKSRQGHTDRPRQEQSGIQTEVGRQARRSRPDTGRQK